MAALEIEGRIASKLALQSGQSARGAWSRQDFVLEYQDGSFPVSVCFTALGEDKVNELNRFQVGDKVKVSFNLRGREYNGRWYNDLRIWRITPADAAPQAPAGAPAPQDQAPAPTFADLPPATGVEDDLPF